MEPNCVADKLTTLLTTLRLDESQKRVLLEAISDLRAAYCSYCNRTLISTTYIEAGTDIHKNKLLKCDMCNED